MKVNTSSYEYIVNKYQDLVYKLARRLDYGKMHFDDLVQAGFMGLLYASNNFDFTKNTNFISYASKYIISEIKKENRKASLYKTSDYFLKLKSKIDKLKDLSIKEIAEKTGTSIENIMLIKSMENDTISLEEDKYPSPNINFIEIVLSNEELQLYKLRIVNKYSQNEISKILNVSQSTVSRMLKKLQIKIIQEGLYK